MLIIHFNLVILIVFILLMRIFIGSAYRRSGFSRDGIFVGTAPWYSFSERHAVFSAIAAKAAPTRGRDATQRRPGDARTPFPNKPIAQKKAGD
jgi:hypothetical protein